MLKSNYEFEVIVNGHSAKEYYHNGSYYIEGKEGSSFSLRMRNNSSSRALFVPTVDGLSIMNGKEGSFKSGGYIINAYDSLTMHGWRTSDKNVAEFFFSTPKESYARKMNKGMNLGIIGCAVFKEKEKVKVIEKIIVEKEYIPYYPYPKNPYYPNPWIFPKETWWNNSGTNYFSTATSSNEQTTYTSLGNNGGSGGGAGTSNKGSGNLSAYVSASAAGLGTGFGQDRYSPVTTVDFDSESSPSAVFSLYYNTRGNLEKLGVEFEKPIYATPSAFPDEEGYCERPKN
ncbi:MAG: hypothetical protein WD898_01290 [Candidatus Paceibacterota bacterium]